MDFFTFLIYLVVGVYFLWSLRLVGYFTSSKNAAFWSEPISYPSQLTVIVPFKNESARLPALLSGLQSALRPIERHEVLFIDDHSTDDGANLIKTFDDNSFQVIKNSGSGKKAAIETGVEKADFNFIFTTDADCELPTDCFRGLPTDGKEAVMICGAVIVKNSAGLLGAFQHVESLILAFLTAAFIKGKHPLTCTGANLFYGKSLFREVNPYADNRSIHSGDDHFFLQKVKAHSRGEIFMNPNHSPVVTQPQTSLKALFSQKARWAGKLKYKGSATAGFTGLFLATVQLAFMASVISGVLNGDILLLTLAGCKVLTDIFIFIVPKHYYKSKVSYFYALAVSLLYPLYFGVVSFWAFLPGRSC